MTMQQAFATSAQALHLLAETQIIMGAARSNSATLPTHGQSVEMNIGTPGSLEVLSAPRDCKVHIGPESFTINLTPSADTSIQDVTAAALKASAAPAPQTAAPTLDPGMGPKK